MDYSVPGTFCKYWGYSSGKKPQQAKIFTLVEFIMNII